ncbi:type VII secretion integral membrane protein EccD [Allokutzneria oryzae]|uniref:Type VII secretion integral membrane protein EccD n=1 Tax=Allokutzneria oryzae TaxID=1378989 RepID=A0ABV6A7B4_9PSEU
MNTVAAGDLCRLTVATPNGSADLAVPVGVPVALLLPTLVRHADPELAHRGPWVLQRLGEPPLDENDTPAGLGLRDGDVVHLRPSELAMPAMDFDDVVDGVGAAIRDRPDQWLPGMTRVLFLGLAGIALLAALAGLLVPGPSALRAVLAGVVALLLVVGGTVCSRALGDGRTGVVLGVAALPFAALAAALVFGSGHIGPTVLLAGSAATLAAALAWVGVGTAVPVFLGATTATGCAALAGLLLVWPGLSGAQAAAAVATVAFAVSIRTPNLAARMVRLRLPQLPTSAQDLDEDIEPVGERAVLDGAALADRYVSALFVAAGAVCTASFAVLVTEPAWAPRCLVAVLCAALLLRSRVLVSAWQRLAAVLPGVLGLALLLVALVAVSGLVWRVVLLVGAVVVAGLFVAGARRLPGRRLLPIWGRAADLSETVLTIAVVPLALTVLNVFALVRSLAG